MKGLRKFLSPFTPDISGASAALYELGGIIVIADAGGCTGNVCGFDEPRWFSQKSAVFSAGLRDMDAILGRDDRFMRKIEDAAAQIDASFIAVVGTPVPAVIAMDYRAITRIEEKNTGLPVITVDSTGMALYDKGQEKAYCALFDRFSSRGGGESFVGVLGATPLDIPANDSGRHLAEALGGAEKARLYGMRGTLDDIRHAGDAEKNIVVSPSGFKAARMLKEKFGTPYEAFYPTDGFDPGKFLAGRSGRRILVIHQQVFANALRDKLRETGLCEKSDVASWFIMDDEIAESGDVRLVEEDDLLRAASDGGYDLIIGDPLFKRALRGWNGEFAPLPHFAVSGCLRAAESEEKFWGGLYEKL